MQEDKKVVKGFIFLAVAICSLLAVVPRADAITNVRNAVGSNNGATTIAVTMGAAPANGNALIAVIGTRGTATGNVTSITQTGATWTRAAEVANANGVTTEIWQALNVSGAGTGITVNLGSSLKASCVVVEYSGIATSSAFDVSATNTGNSTAPSTGLTVTTNQAEELWVGGMANINTYTYSGQTNGFTEVAESASTGGAGSTRNNTVFEEKIVHSTAQASTAATLSTLSQWAGVIATFKAQIINVTGTAYNDETSAKLTNCNGSTNMITLRYESTTYGPTTCSGTDGSFSFNNVAKPSTSAPMTFYIDNVSSTYGTTIDRYSGGGNVSSVPLRKDRLTVMHDDSGPITNANLSGWDSDDDTDIVFISNGGALSVADGIKLIVNGSDTFTPGGTVTTSPSSAPSSTDGDVKIESGATLNMGTNALSVGGDYDNSGTFSKLSGQTTTFTATATGFSIAPGTGNFDSVTFNGSGGGWSFSAAPTLDGNLTMTAGTLSGTSNINVNGGGVTGDGDINMTGGTFTAVGTGNFGGNADWDFYNLTFGDGVNYYTTTGIGTGSITVSSVLINSEHQAFNAGSKTYILTGSGSPFQTANSSSGNNTSTFRYTSTSNTNINDGFSYYNVELQPSGAGTPTYTLQNIYSAFPVGNNLIIGDGANPVIVSTSSVWQGMSITANLTLNANGTLSGSGTGTITVSGSVSGAGTINLSDGTFQQQLYSASRSFGTTSGSNNWTFKNLTFSNTSPISNLTITPNAGGAGNITVNGILQIGKGTDTYNTTFDNETANDRDLIIAGEVSITSKGILSVSSTKSFTIGGNFTNDGTLTANSGTVTFDDNSKVSTILNPTGGTAFNNLNISTPSKEVDFDATDQTNVSGTFTVNGGACNTQVKLRASGGAPFNINAASGSVQYADIQGSTAVSPLTASNSSDSGGNSGWAISYGECAAPPGTRITGGINIRGGTKVGQ